MSSRYITTDVKTGEIIHSTNRHPMLDPLRRPRARRRSRFTPQQRKDAEFALYAGCLLGLIVAMFIS